VLHELTTQNLTELSYPYVNETTNLFDLIIGSDVNYIPASSKALAYLVNKSVVESFGTTDTNIRKELVETSTNGPAVQQLINNILIQMVERVTDPDPNKYWLGGYQNGNFDNINLSYPASDILNYNNMRSFSQQLNSQLLNATFSGEFCDSLSTTRRVNASQSLVMLIRLLIVEQAMITIQVFDKFDLAFMESDIFITNIQTLLFNETIKYGDSFGLTTSLYSDLTAAAKKYYEILAFLGEQEPVEFETDAEYLKDIIRIEANNLRSPIVNALNLGQNWKSWDGFVTNRLFPTFDAPSDINSDYQSSFQTPPDNQTVTNFDRFVLTATGRNQVTEQEISNFVDETKTSFKDSLGDSVPNQLYDIIFSAFNEWVSTLSLPTYDNLISLNQISDTLSLDIGVANYNISYTFTVEGREQGTASGGTQDVTDITITATFGGQLSDDFESSTSSEAFLSPFAFTAGKGGFAFEKYVDYKTKTQGNVLTGYQSFLLDLSDDSDLNSLLFDKFEYIRFGYRMVYVADYAYEFDTGSDSFVTTLSDSIKNLQDSKNIRDQQKAFYVTNQTRTVNGASEIYDMVTFPIVSAECEYVDTTTNQDITIQQFLDSIEQKYNDEIFNNIKNMLLETDEYKIVIDNVLCLKELIASLSFYEYASLSDETVFLSGVSGVSLHNITSRAKLSTLQTFYASIYGEGQISYQDPFTKNVIT
jgi:hypothetical protein